MNSALIKSAGIWLVIVFVAILNGVVREKVLVPILDEKLALPLSGVLLAILVFMVAFLFIPSIGSAEPKTYVLIGILWVVLTLVFEFSFGHFVAGKAWCEILLVFDIRNGNLFSAVLFVTAISPWLAARTRGFL